MAQDDTTKLIIYGLGLVTIGFLVFVIYKEVRQTQSQPVSVQLRYQEQLMSLEQKLIELQNKVDNASKSMSTIQRTERTKVQMPKTLNRKGNSKEMFDML